MKKPKKMFDIKAGVITSAFLMGIVYAVAFILIFANTTPIVEEEPVEGPKWHKLAEIGADAEPGTGASGILEIFFYPHNATGEAYNTNLSDSAAYANVTADDFYTEIQHTDAWDFVVKVRANKTHAYDSEWNVSRMHVIVNSTSLSLTDCYFTGAQTSNNSNADYTYVQFYNQSSGSGFTLGLDATATIENIVYQVYY